MTTMIIKLLNNVLFHNLVFLCQKHEQIVKIIKKFKIMNSHFVLRTRKKFKIIFCPNCGVQEKWGMFIVYIKINDKKLSNLHLENCKIGIKKYEWLGFNPDATK